MSGNPSSVVAAVGTRVDVTVPASTGNVGPGFDSMGLALGLYDELSVTVIPEGLEFDLHGAGVEDLPRSPKHLVVRAMQATFDAAGAGSLPGLRLSTQNRISHGRGMGSSASAVVAGVLAANALLDESVALGSEAVLQVCSDMEGHPDNVAPTLYGGLTVSFEQDGTYVSVPVSIDEQLLAVVAVPDYEVATSLARGLLPEAVPHRDAAVNSGRSALLVEAMSRRPEFLFAATQDLLHQQYRAQAMGPSAALMKGLRERGEAAIISGAGPTVLVAAHGEAAAEKAVGEIHDLVSESGSETTTYRGAPVSWTVMTLRVPIEGAKVEVYTH